MEYIRRDLERKCKHMNTFFKVLWITGARQVGKTTMLKELAKDEDRTYVTMDHRDARALAQSDPALFFQMYKPPILIDEIQKAPELLEHIKLLCDATEETGLFWITGSNQHELLKKTTETLAGRVGILPLYSLSRNEKEGVQYPVALDFSLSCLLERQKVAKENDIVKTFHHIWLGGMPQALQGDEEQRQVYYDSYIQTYVLGDAVEDGNISDVQKFAQFIRVCAAFTGQLLNYATLAESCGISAPTAKEWVRTLQGMGIIYLLEPYYNNTLSRLVKTPKLYFCDTGLAAYLSKWLTPETLMNGAASGAFFENYVVMELVKNFAYSADKVDLSFYRDSNAKEIDLFVKKGDTIHPLEIKKSASPDRREIKKFSILDKADEKKGCGGIICMANEVMPIDGENQFIPCHLL